MEEFNFKDLNIAVIGGKAPCKDILELLIDDGLKDLNCRVLSIADASSESQGIRFACENNLPTTNNFKELFTLKPLDLILLIHPDPSLRYWIDTHCPKEIRVMSIDRHGASALILSLSIQKERSRIMQQIRSGEIDPTRLEDTIDTLCSRFQEMSRAQSAYFKAESRNLLLMEEELGQIIHGSMIPTFIINNNHVVTHWNRACEDLTGFKSHQLIGTDRQWSPFRKSQRPTMADVIVNGMDESQITEYYGDKWKKSTLIPEAYEAEEFFPHLGENGKWIFFTAAPIKSEDGKIIGAIETLRDSTQEKKAQAELDSQYRTIAFMHDQYRILFNNNPNPIFMVDSRTLEIININKRVEDEYGYQPKELIGTPFFDVMNRMAVDLSYTPEMIKLFQQQASQNRADRMTPWKEITLKKKDGGHVPVRYSTSFLHKKGTLVGSAFFFHNLTEIKKLEKELVQSERLAAIGQTISGLAHYIKNILLGLKGGSYVMDIGIKNENTEKIKAGWQTIKNNIDRTSELVQNLLTYSKERKPEFTECLPNDIVEDVIKLVDSHAASQNIGVMKALDPDLGNVRMDPQTIHRSLLNLVTNAMDACRNVEDDARDLQIHLSTTLNPDQTISFRVRDNGTGMSQKDRDNLFAPFYSAKGQKGTGLGLMVTAKLVEEHRGRIQVDSTFGEGTCFTITLPFQPADPDAS
ncbi:MAG: PAS domain-containing sensor histidine kinase [Desulfobacteraceae bacterium]|nr:MAG: PAS domain-containing sensor histidine kinase [Desulfobacteraceae bacterium]